MAAGFLLAASAFLSPALAQVPATKSNILFVMRDDIGWMQVGAYHRGLALGETPNIDRIGQEGAVFTDYYAIQELHLRAQRVLHRHVPAAHRHDPAAAPRQPELFAAGHPGGCQVLA